MNEITSHRGGDGTGVYVKDGVSLGHNRLSIIDVDTRSNQPMISGDGSMVIVFNGEIYNYKELKRELEEAYTFKTKSDTEVILAAHKKWGYDAPKRFSGIFSYVLWNRQKCELILVRDQVGVKPLYYYLNNGQIIFSSEIKGILEHKEVPRVLDIESFNHYLRVGYTPEPRTLFKDIKKFPAGYYGVFTKGAFTLKQYWSLDLTNVSQSKKSRREIAVDLKDKISDVVKKQLVSDKPLGVYLSGGLDSSILVDRVSSLLPAVETFSVGFDLREDEEREKFNIDYELAKKTSKYYGTRHNSILVSVGDVINNLEKAIWHMDEPVLSPTTTSRIMLAQFTKQKVDVALVGDGGDELFGGYYRYQNVARIKLYQSLVPGALREFLSGKHPLLKKVNTRPGLEQLKLFMYQKDPTLESVVNSDYLTLGITDSFFKERFFHDTIPETSVRDLMDVDRQSWMRDFAMMLGDKTTMSSALEARVPLLDIDLLEYAATIPTEHKVNVFQTKIILREAFKNDLPEFILNKPKHGWVSPAAKWLRHEIMYKKAKEILSPDYHKATRKLFLWEEVEKILDEHYMHKKYNMIIIWSLLSFQIWAQKFNVTLEDQS